MAYHPNIHHRRSIRLRDYDYASCGAYFVTLCAFQRTCLFGEVTDGTVQLNACGELIFAQWLAIPEHFPSIDLDEFVVMPNHLHGILISTPPAVGARFIAPKLGEVVRAFKARCTQAINRQRGDLAAPVWQRNYFERIIRDEAEAQLIRHYIAINPAHWAEDDQHPCPATNLQQEFREFRGHRT